MTRAAHARATPMRLPARRRDPAAERDARGLAAGRVAPVRGRRDGEARALPRARRAGEPLPLDVRSWAEPQLGLDLGAVRVHDDGDAHLAAEERHARALAAGSDVLFAAGEYRPGTPAGRELLLHELAHVGQQADRGEDAVQHDDGPPRTRGLGRTPPAVDYAVASAPAVDDEDLHVLFAHDDTLVEADLAERIRVAVEGHSGAVVVRIHGYASSEGEGPYNLNLSAHRAVAVQRAIAAVLPAGSSVWLVAHGETGAFGDTPEHNRRAGIEIADLPAGDFTLDASRYLRRHRPPWGDFGLQLDPTLTPPTFPPPPAGASPVGGVLDWPIVDPTSVLAAPSRAPSSLGPDPALDVGPRVPWGQFAADFRSRGVTLGAGDAAVILDHWQRWYPLARGIHGLPAVRWFSDGPDDLMTTFTRRMFSSSLVGEHPNPIEAFDQDLRRRGIETPIYLPSFELRFDPDFRNWRRP